MPTLSIIIPVLGNVADLERTLVSVLEHRPDDCEILAVLNAPYDDPYELAGEVRFLTARRRAGFVECVNAGLRESAAPFVHILQAGLEATSGWCDSALDQFADEQVAAVAPLVLETRGKSRPLAAGLRYGLGGKRIVNSPKKAPTTQPHERLAVLGPCGCAAFYRRTALETLGETLPAIVGDDLADVHWALELRRHGFRAVLDARSEVHADALPKPRHGQLRGGLFAERLFWLHAAEQGRWPSILLHPLTALSEVLGALPNPAALLQLVGRLWACGQFGLYRRVAAARVELSATQEPEEFRSSEAGSARRIDAAHPANPSMAVISTRIKQRAR